MKCGKGRTRRTRTSRRTRKPVGTGTTLMNKMKASGVQPDPPHFQEAAESSRFDRW